MTNDNNAHPADAGASDKTELREQAFALYKPPFKFRDGYIYDSADHMVSDGPDETGIQRVRGWGRIGCMPKGEQLQDAVGELIAEALTSAWNRRATIQPAAAEPVQRWTAEEIAEACVKAGLGILECNSLIVTLKGTAAAPVAPADAVRDAERYRLLRQCCVENTMPDSVVNAKTGEQLDDACDAAIMVARLTTPKEPAK